MASVTFLITLYISLLREKAMKNLLDKHVKREETYILKDIPGMQFNVSNSKYFSILFNCNIFKIFQDCRIISGIFYNNLENSERSCNVLKRS